MDPVLESWLFRDPRNNRRLGGLGHPADHAFTGAVAGRAHHRLGTTAGRFDQKFLAVGQQQHHRAAEHAESSLQDG